MKYLRIMRKLLRGRAIVNVKGAFDRQCKAFHSAHLLVRGYYVVTLYLLATQLDRWNKWLTLEEIHPLWPVAWVELTGIPAAVHIIMTVALVTATLCMLFPEKRIFRISLFIGLLEYTAFSYSFGYIGHSWHGWLAFGFFFIFLPDGKREQLEGSITSRQIYLSTFWAAQALVMGFYSMSGFWKFIAGVYQFLAGEVNVFSQDALARQIANQLLRTESTSLFGNFFIENPLLGLPLNLGALYLEIFAFVAVFRFSLHRFWGVSLILFHLVTYLIMEVSFHINILLLGLFFVYSPFVPPNNSWRVVLHNLPLIGWVLESLSRLFDNKVKRAPVK